MKCPRVVVDTNVLVSALRSKRGASHRLLLLVDSGKFEMCLSTAVLLEYEEVCKRLAGDFGLEESDVDDVLDYLCRQADHVEIHYLWRPFLLDAKDDMFMELAIAGNCEWIVTFNERHFKGVEQFGIGLLTPRELLAEIGELP